MWNCEIQSMPNSINMTCCIAWMVEFKGRVVIDVGLTLKGKCCNLKPYSHLGFHVSSTFNHF